MQMIGKVAFIGLSGDAIFKISGSLDMTERDLRLTVTSYLLA